MKQKILIVAALSPGDSGGKGATEPAAVIEAVHRLVGEIKTKIKDLE